MSPDEAAAVLAYAAAADARFTTPDAEQAKARTQVWADLLAEVPAQFGLDHVRRYYRSHHDWPITPGAVRDAWRSHQRAEEAKARNRALLAAPTAPQALGEAGAHAKAAARSAATEAAARGLPERTPSTPLRYVAAEVFEGGAGHG